MDEPAPPAVTCQEPFVRVPVWLLELGLSHSARVLAEELLNLGALTRSAYPSIAYLCRRLNLCERKVRNLLRELEKAGALTTYHQKGKASRYRIQKPTPACPCRTPRHGGAGHPGTPVPPDPDLLIQKIDPEKSRPAAPSARKEILPMKPPRPRKAITPDEEKAAKAATVLIQHFERDPRLAAQGFKAGAWWGKGLNKLGRHPIPMLESLAQLGRFLSANGKPPTSAFGYLEDTYREKEANYYGAAAERASCERARADRASSTAEWETIQSLLAAGGAKCPK